jgi:hypothetical protein
MKMSKAKKLSKRQLAVIEDLFIGELDEQALLDKHKISRNTFNKWLADELFVGQFNERMDSSFRQSRLIIARYAPLAAAKLVQLTESDKEETARKACLDVISMGQPNSSLADTGTASDDDKGLQDVLPELSPEAAGRILAALAEDG